MMIEATKLKGIYDIYATIDLAEYLCRVYDTTATKSELYFYTGITIPNLAQITRPEQFCGALASALVNSPLYADSAFKYNHAYYFDLDTVKILDADRPKTEYNLALAIRDLSNKKEKRWAPIEELFTGKEYIDTHSTKYTKNDLYSKVLFSVLTK